MKKQYGRLVYPLVALFVIANALLLVFQRRLGAMNVNIDVAISGNLLLFLVSIANIWFQLKSMTNPKLSPGTQIRMVMAGTFIKLFVLASAAVIYLVAAGKDRSVNAVFVTMALYIVYTWLEVKISLRMNARK